MDCLEIEKAGIQHTSHFLALSCSFQMHVGLLKVRLRPYKKISMFQVTGLKILGRVGTHILCIFSGKKYNFIHFERHFTFQNP